MPSSRFILLAAVAMAFAGIGPAAMSFAASKPAATAATAAVHISNFTFGPQVLKVRVGQTVVWVNDDDIPHTVTAADHSFKSKVLDTGDKFSFTFTHPGSAAYFCSLHPHMTGKVLVTA